MTKGFFLKCVSLFFLVQSFNFSAQEKVKDRAVQEGVQEEAMEFAMPEPEPKVEEIHNPDGSYRQVIDGVTRIKGSYKGKTKHGEFTYYRKDKTVAKEERFVDGLLEGFSTDFTDGRKIAKEQYKKGKKINYEYEFEGYDTSFIAGPYPEKDQKEGMFVIRRKVQDYENYNLLRLFYDTIFYAANKPVIIKHHELMKERREIKQHSFTEANLYKINQPVYSPDLISSLAEQTKYFNSRFGIYPPSTKKIKVKYYDEKGKLVMSGDSGYVLVYRDTRIDSLTQSVVGKVAQSSFEKNGRLFFEVRYDTAANRYYTNLYYGKNKKLLYEVGSRNSVPDYVKIYDDSVRKASAGNVLLDYFGTAYVFNSKNKIDTTFSRLEYKLRVKENITSGRYFCLPYAPLERKEYRIIEFTGNRKNEYTVDSLFEVKKDKGPTFQVYQNDSLLYYVKEVSTSREKFLNYKYLRKNGKLYQVHNRLKKRYIWYREEQLTIFENDTIPVLRSELLTEADLKKAFKLKSIVKMDRPTFTKWMEGFMKLMDLDETLRNSLKLNIDEYYETRGSYEICMSELYKMGYNPYFTRKEIGTLEASLKLSEEERYKYRFLFR